jgi:hypothetical protein
VLKIPVSKGFSHRIANLEIEPFDHAGVFGLIKGQSFYTIPMQAINGASRSVFWEVKE